MCLDQPSLAVQLSGRSSSPTSPRPIFASCSGYCDPERPAAQDLLDLCALDLSEMAEGQSGEEPPASLRAGLWPKATPSTSSHWVPPAYLRKANIEIGQVSPCHLAMTAKSTIRPQV